MKSQYLFRLVALLFILTFFAGIYKIAKAGEYKIKGYIDGVIPLVDFANKPFREEEITFKNQSLQNFNFNQITGNEFNITQIATDYHTKPLTIGIERESSTIAKEPIMSQTTFVNNLRNVWDNLKAGMLIDLIDACFETVDFDSVDFYKGTRGPDFTGIDDYLSKGPSTFSAIDKLDFSTPLNITNISSPPSKPPF